MDEAPKKQTKASLLKHLNNQLAELTGLSLTDWLEKSKEIITIEDGIQVSSKRNSRNSSHSRPSRHSFAIPVRIDLGNKHFVQPYHCLHLANMARRTSPFWTCASLGLKFKL
jgi:hypothetical protein